MKSITILICGLGLFLATGCSFFKSAPMTRYYLLDYVPEPAPIKTSPAVRPATLRIKDFKIAEAYKRSEIVYRKSAHEMEFYNYHQWAVKPEYIVTDMVYKHIRASNLFKSITRSLADFRPDYTLTGEVIALEEYDSDEKWFAHLAVSFQLENAKTEKQIWNRTFDVRKEVAQKEPVYVVREMSSLLEYITDKVIEEIATQLPKYAIPEDKDQKADTRPDVPALSGPGSPQPESSDGPSDKKPE